MDGRDLCSQHLRFRRCVGFAVSMILCSSIALPSWSLSEDAKKTDHQVEIPDQKKKKLPYEVVVERHVEMTTTDGIKLSADVFHPKNLEKTPTILVRIPFSKTPKNTVFSTVIGKIWARRGYTAVVQGTRGRYESGGTYYPMVNERKDGIETLTWLAKQPWYNGEVATWGGSAFGQTQWAISDQKNPGPTSMAVYLASSHFHDMFHPGGAFSLCSALTWAVNSHGKEDRSSWPGEREIFKGAKGFPMIDSDKRIVGKEIPFFRDWARHEQKDAYWESIDGVEMTKSLSVPVQLIAGWYDPFLQSELDDWRAIKQSPSNIVSSKSRLVIGPWTHAHEVTFPNGADSEHFRLSSMATNLKWFERNLGRKNSDTANKSDRLNTSATNFSSSEFKSHDSEAAGSSSTETANSILLLPAGNIPLTVPWFENQIQKAAKLHPDDNAPVSIFVMGVNKWRNEQEWPLARAKMTPLYLTGGGKANGITGSGTLSFSEPPSEASDSYDYNPENPVSTAGGAMIGPAAGIRKQNDIEARSDVLVYTTPVLKNDSEVTGPVEAVLYVSTSAVSTDFTAKLVDVYPDGKAYNLCDGILRRRYDQTEGRPHRETDGTSEVHEIKIRLWPTSNVFFKGHKIRVEISSSNFPRFDLNPNTGSDSTTETRSVIAHQKVYHGKIYPSRIVLPIIP